LKKKQVRLEKYKRVVEEYLLWRVEGEVFQRPNFEYSFEGKSALEAMRDWESYGVPLPRESCEPELLADYVQGKKSRDWHISQWREGIKAGLFYPWEFVGELGCTNDNVETLLGYTSLGIDPSRFWWARDDADRWELLK